MKKILFILALMPLIMSCSKDSDVSDIEQAKNDYKWLESNIEGYWDEVFYEGENIGGILKERYALFKDGKVYSDGLFGIHLKEETYQLKYDNSFIYLFIGKYKYRVLNINEQEHTMFIEHPVGELKKRSGSY